MSEALDKLLQSPRLWRGQATGTAWQGLASGYPRLDEHLPGGGWPRSALTEILLDEYGSGELQLLMPALARLSRDSAPGWLAWIAPPFQPYAPALAQWGIRLSRVLVVRPSDDREALWAAEQALNSGNCAAVLTWARRIDSTASRRLQLAAAEGKSWAVLFRPSQDRQRHSAAALRLALRPGRRGTDLHILKTRGGRPAAIPGAIPDATPGIVEDYAALADH